LTEERADEIAKQNELIISLLGRIAFKNDELKDIVTKGSKKPEQMIQAYNLCDGTTGLTEIAKEAGVAQPSLTNAVDKWEKSGIILKKKKGKEVLPLRLFEIR
jgi:DNA-binding MarR family transcriptional regulator